MHQTMGQKLKKARLDNSLTMERTAELSHLSRQTIHSIENDIGKAPSFDTISKLCKVYGLDISELTDEDKPFILGIYGVSGSGRSIFAYLLGKYLAEKKNKQIIFIPCDSYIETFAKNDYDLNNLFSSENESLKLDNLLKQITRNISLISYNSIYTISRLEFSPGVSIAENIKKHLISQADVVIIDLSNAYIQPFFNWCDNIIVISDEIQGSYRNKFPIEVLQDAYCLHKALGVKNFCRYKKQTASNQDIFIENIEISTISIPFDKDLFLDNYITEGAFYHCAAAIFEKYYSSYID